MKGSILVTQNELSMASRFSCEQNCGILPGICRLVEGDFMRRYVLLALTCAGVLIAVGGAALAFRNHGQRSDSVIFGVSDPTLISETAKVQTAQLAEMKAIGISSLRVEANWRAVQPNSPESYDWGRLDQELSLIRGAGLSIDLVIDGCPSWAAIAGARGNEFSQPASPAKYASFAERVASRYAGIGVKIYEIWNEPNRAEFWQPSPNPAAYTADLIASYTAIKAVDPSALVISGGLAPGPNYSTNISPIDFLKAMYANGAKGNFDALGFHPYSYPAAPATYESWSGWSQMSLTVPSMRSVMAMHGDSHRQIWITEFGAPTTGSSSVGATKQRSMLYQAVTFVRKTDWIGAFYIYTWQDSSIPGTKGDGFGLLTSHGLPKPAYSVVAALMRK